MHAESIILVLFLLICPGVSYQGLKVNYGTNQCVPQASSVDIGCSYEYPSGYKPVKTLWIINGKYVDFSRINQQGRLEYLGDKSNNCTLRITGVTNSGAGPYKFRFETDKADGKWTGEPPVTLSVTALQVEMTPTAVTEGQSVTLTCRSSCPGDTNPTYIWYHTRQPVTNQHTIRGNTLTLSSVSKRDAGRYSCALRGHEDHPSPSVCVLNCWSVVYTHQSICAVKGSSVDLGCSFSYPHTHTVTETFWHEPKIIEDLSKKGEYANRVKYLGNKDSDCALRIEDLRESDSGEYRFRFLTNPGGAGYSGSPGVTLSVLTLQVEMSPTAVTEGQSVTLTCRPTCDTGAEPTFVWYKNRLHVANQHPTMNRTMTINPVSKTHSGHYSCAVQGYENHPSPAVALNVHYSPKNTLSSKFSDGHSATLTCDSDANPPVQTYTWYKKTGDDSVHEVSGKNRTLTLVSGDGGLYYCVAHNQYGSHNSSAIEVTFSGGAYPISLPRLVCSLLLVTQFLVLTVIVVVKCHMAPNSLKGTKQRSSKEEKREDAVVEEE